MWRKFCKIMLKNLSLVLSSSLRELMAKHMLIRSSVRPSEFDE
jgi:hypothetical protein